MCNDERLSAGIRYRDDIRVVVAHDPLPMVLMPKNR
jgi:hypothetical protein